MINGKNIEKNLERKTKRTREIKKVRKEERK